MKKTPTSLPLSFLLSLSLSFEGTFGSSNDVECRQRSDLFLIEKK